MLDATAAFELDEVTALSLLEGCDLAEDVEAIPSSIVDPVSAPKARKRQCCRLARRDEVINLRKAEKQLCTQLRQLQQALRLKSRPDKKQLDGTLHNVLTWEEICHRQAARRAESEEEGKKLRNEVQRRLWQAKQLLKGFKRRLRHEVCFLWEHFCKSRIMLKFFFAAAGCGILDQVVQAILRGCYWCDAADG